MLPGSPYVVLRPPFDSVVDVPRVKSVGTKSQVCRQQSVRPGLPRPADRSHPSTTNLSHAFVAQSASLFVAGIQDVNVYCS